MESVNEDTIWQIADQNKVSDQQDQQQKQQYIMEYPKELFLHGIHADYRAMSVFEWIFHFVLDKAISAHKKTRVLRILFKDKGRKVVKILSVPQTFIVVSEPEKIDKKIGVLKEAAHVYTVVVDKHGRIFCPCEWEGTTGIQTCTHILAVRGYIFAVEKEDDGERGRRKQQTSETQGENQVCTNLSQGGTVG